MTPYSKRGYAKSAAVAHKRKRHPEQTTRERAVWPCEYGCTNRMRDKRCGNCGAHKP